ncbi:hypothetical protein QF031_003384 [Pseudarthrobacter defluvii]|uniref:DUF998 domain-containing protein n=1 Tax=Pseudarthrobacter defluvii TaxID=410837 RepID=UPI00277F4C96|nr:DUF998 domain-containing protein [Pseudarthrobacter defluvii]MDQ0770635.1 hypothetical protein [Pseudarthrobacter defluvii]
MSGIAASLLYATMIWLIRYPGYDPMSQTVSELSAWDVSTRTVWVWLGLLWSALLAAFAAGVWRSGSRRRSLRVTGILLGAYVLAGLAYPFASMHTREVLAAGGATAADTAHLIIVSVTSALMLAAMVSSAVAFGLWFRLYTAATILLLIGFGLLTAGDASAVQTNLPTPWTGLCERVNILVTLAWVAVLALLLIHRLMQSDLSVADQRNKAR